MLLELLFSAAAVYGGAAAYKVGKGIFGGNPGRGLAGRDGKYHLNGKTYDTIEEYSLASWRDAERTRLRRIDEMKSIGLDGPLDEDDLRRKVREWDEKGI